MKTPEVLIFIVTENAAGVISDLMTRLPAEFLARFRTELLLLDNCSSDETINCAIQNSPFTLRILRNTENLSYGENQKIGYRYAIDAGFDYVAFLNGDGQYAPEALESLLTPLVEGYAQAAFASRTSSRSSGVPRIRWLANRLSTALQNSIVGSSLSDHHSSFRAFSTRTLALLPFERNTDSTEFDTEIVIQFFASGFTILDIPVAVEYRPGHTAHHAVRSLVACLHYRAQRLGIFYDAKFDLERENLHYHPKFDFCSSHSIALERTPPQEPLLILGSGPKELVEPFARRAPVSVVDQFVTSELSAIAVDSWEADLNSFSFVENTVGKSYTRILALDIIEHLQSPECFLEKIRHSPSTQEATLVITTPNIAFLPIRIMLTLGFFNYGKRGILDRTHTRLFTFSSLRRLLVQQGFEVLDVEGIPAPFPLALGRNAFSRALVSLGRILCALFPGIFSYQIYAEARPRPTVENLIEKAASAATKFVVQEPEPQGKPPVPVANG